MQVMRKPSRIISTAATVVLGGSAAMFSTGCANDAQTGLLMGTAAGAGIGAIAGHNMGGRTAEGAAIGAGVGALGGYIIGNESDKGKSQYNPNYRY